MNGHVIALYLFYFSNQFYIYICRNIIHYASATSKHMNGHVIVLNRGIGFITNDSATSKHNTLVIGIERISYV